MRRLNAAWPIVLPDGTMSRPMQDQMNRLGAELPILGDGPPEGVVEAPQYSLYIDRNGAAGAIQYRKMQSDIGGDKTMGWLAV